jgi:hypothetical protein
VRREYLIPVAQTFMPEVCSRRDVVAAEAKPLTLEGVSYRISPPHEMSDPVRKKPRRDLMN